MSSYTEEFNGGKMIVTHPTGVVDEYDIEHLQALFRIAEAELDDAYEQCRIIDGLIDAAKNSLNSG